MKARKVYEFVNPRRKKFDLNVGINNPALVRKEVEKFFKGFEEGVTYKFFEKIVPDKQTKIPIYNVLTIYATLMFNEIDDIDTFVPIPGLNLINLMGSLYLKNSTVEYLSDNLVIGGTLDLTNCPISVMPDNLEVEYNMIIKGTNITKEDVLNSNAKIKGKIID